MLPLLAPRCSAPARLAGLTLRNRVIKTATYEGMTPGGVPSPALIEHHRALAAGGVGMTTVAYCAVSPNGRTFAEQMYMREAIVPALGELTDVGARRRRRLVAAARPLRLLQQEPRDRPAPAGAVAGVQRLRADGRHAAGAGDDRGRHRHAWSTSSGGGGAGDAGRLRRRRAPPRPRLPAQPVPQPGDQPPPRPVGRQPRQPHALAAGGAGAGAGGGRPAGADHRQDQPARRLPRRARARRGGRRRPAPRGGRHRRHRAQRRLHQHQRPSTCSAARGR